MAHSTLVSREVSDSRDFTSETVNCGNIFTFSFKKEKFLNILDLDESSRMFSEDHREGCGEIFQQIDTYRLRQILQQVHEIQGQQQQQQQQQEERVRTDNTKIQRQVPSVEQPPVQYHHQQSGHTQSDNTPLHHPMLVPQNSADPSFAMPRQNVVPETMPQIPHPPTYPTPPPVMWMPVFVPPQPTRSYPCPDCGCCAAGPAPLCRQNVSSQPVEKNNTNGLFGHTHLQSSKRDLFESALTLAKSFVGENRTGSSGSSSSSFSQSSPAKSDSSSPSVQSTTSTKIGNIFLLDFQQTTMLAFAYEIDNQMDKDVFNCEHLAHLLFVPPSAIRVCIPSQMGHEGFYVLILNHLFLFRKWLENSVKFKPFNFISEMV